MAKWKLILFMMTLIVAHLAIAATETECELSLDNATWEDVNLTKWGGSINDGERIATAPTLESSTRYYFRCKNSTTSWAYVNQKTDLSVREDDMYLAISLFLLGINVVAFALPLWVKRFHPAESTNYVIKRMIWVASVVLLWFNTTIFRVMAENESLGIDDMLLGYWWVFTIACFVVVFGMIWFGVVGLVKIIKEVKERSELGELE